MKKSVWLTYDWRDNENKDVDFCVQELESDLIVKRDQRDLIAGKRLWEQIEHVISNASQSDGWLIYATQNSLTNEKCKEELSYALDRALETRGADYPIIGIFPSSIDRELIPAPIRTRRYVTLKDPDWKERIVAAIEKKQPNVTKPVIEPYFLRMTLTENEDYVIELRPRAGTWSPFIIAIPLEEKDIVSLNIKHGPANDRNPRGMACMLSTRCIADPTGRYWIWSVGNEATPTQSYYIICKKLPSILIFGQEDGTQYTRTFQMPIQ